MRKLNRFIPGFLKKADLFLLENHPMIWVTKIHYVAFFSVTMIGLAAIWNALKPINLANQPEQETAFFMLMIPALIGGAIWAIYQLIFNVEKNYGHTRIWSDLAMHGLYVVVLGLFLAIPISGGFFANMKLASARSKSELIQDINTLNRGYLIFSSRPREKEYSDYYSFPFTPYDFYSEKLTAAEDLKKLDLSVRTRAEVQADLDAFNQVYTRYSEAAAIEYPEVIDNYFNGYRQHNADYLYDSYEVEQNIQNLVNARNMEFFLADEDVNLGFLYTIFCISVLLVMLKNVQLKHFLIAAIAGLLCIPLLALVGELAREFRVSDNEDAVIITMVLMVGFLAYQSFSILKTQKFSGLKAVSIILFNAFLPFVFVFMAISYEIMGHSYHPVSEKEIWVLLYAGAALHTLVGITLLKRLYRRLQALPA